MGVWSDYLKWLQENPQEPQLCECGSELEVTAQCLTCGKWLCNKCSTNHKCEKKVS